MIMVLILLAEAKLALFNPSTFRALLVLRDWEGG